MKFQGQLDSISRDILKRPFSLFLEVDGEDFFKNHMWNYIVKFTAVSQKLLIPECPNFETFNFIIKTCSAVFSSRLPQNFENKKRFPQLKNFISIGSFHFIHFNRLMVNLIFGVRASEPSPRVWRKARA